MDIVYIWADGDYIFDCDLEGREPHESLGFNKSDDYFTFTEENKPLDVRHLFNTYLEWEGFVNELDDYLCD